MILSKAILITARSKSFRLPNKMLTNLYNNTNTIEHIIKRAKLSKRADKIILCTTEDQSDDELCRIAQENQIIFFRGSDEDKIERWLGAVEENNIDYFITFDGDDPFCDPELIDVAFDKISNERIDYLTCPNIICGGFTYGFSRKALRKVYNKKKSTDTEMAWIYFRDDSFNVGVLDDINPIYLKSKHRLTLDYPEDLVFFREIFKILGGSHSVTLKEVIEFLNANQKVSQINQFRQLDFELNQQQKIERISKNVQ